MLTENCFEGETARARVFRSEKPLNILLPDVIAEVYLVCGPHGEVHSNGYPVSVYGAVGLAMLEWKENLIRVVLLFLGTSTHVATTRMRSQRRHA